MEKTYFIYNVKQATNEGPSKAFLSTEAGGGSFLFTEKIISSEQIKDSADGQVKVIKSYSSEELLKSIAGIEESKNRKNNFEHFSSDEGNEVAASSLDLTHRVMGKISSMRKNFEDLDAQVADMYDRHEIIHDTDEYTEKTTRPRTQSKKTPSRF